jgi:hypothetical protein
VAGSGNEFPSSLKDSAISRLAEANSVSNGTLLCAVSSVQAALVSVRKQEALPSKQKSRLGA